MRGAKHFFEIPLYRISHEAFNRQYDRDLENYWDSLVRAGVPPRHELSEDFRISTEQHFWERYGGPWRFNQAVGWLRLFIWGYQLRGEVWLSGAKRFDRRALREFRWWGKAFEISVYPEHSSADIIAELREEMKDLQRELHGGRLVFDLECFDAMAPHVDWHALLAPNPDGEELEVLRPTAANATAPDR